MSKLAFLLLFSVATLAVAGASPDAQPGPTNAVASRAITDLPTCTLYVASDLRGPWQDASGLPGAGLDAGGTWFGTRVQEPAALAFAVLGLQVLIRRR